MLYVFKEILVFEQNPLLCASLTTKGKEENKEAKQSKAQVWLTDSTGKLGWEKVSEASNPPRKRHLDLNFRFDFQTKVNCYDNIHRPMIIGNTFVTLYQGMYLHT